MAIQPPHPWFTDSVNEKRHTLYHQEKYINHFSDFCSKIELKRTSQEFIEHICAAILSRYNLFIGIGKYRPLISLLHYMRLNDINNGNFYFWQSLQISNMPGDLMYCGADYFKLKSLLEHIYVRIKTPIEHFEELLNSFKELKGIYDKLEPKIDLLSKINIQTKSNKEIKVICKQLFGYYQKLVLYESCIKFPFIEERPPSNFEPYITFGYASDISNLEIDEFGARSNTILVLSLEVLQSNLLKEEIQQHIPQIDYVINITIKEFYLITISPNRRIEFEKLIRKRMK